MVASGFEVVVRGTLFDTCKATGSGAEGGAVFLAVMSGCFARTCAIGCYAQYRGNSFKCNYDLNGTSWVNLSSIVACPRESGYAWSLNCQYGCAMATSLNLSQCCLDCAVLSLYDVENVDVYRFTTVANNTAEVPICFQKLDSSQKNTGAEFINLVRNRGSGKQYNGFVFTYMCHAMLRDCLISQNTFNRIQHSQPSDTLTFQDCSFCKNTFTSDSAGREDPTTIGARQFLCAFRTGRFTVSDELGVLHSLLALLFLVGT